jgi:hypothetical protein
MTHKTITKIPNLQIDIEAARAWYNDLETKFSDQKWTGMGGCACENPWADDKAYGWGLQTIYEDVDRSYHAFENNEVGDFRLYKPTSCSQGWGEKALNTFPTAHRSVVGVAPPGTIVTPHTDQDNKIKIHIPIYADDTHWWATDDGFDHMYPGNAYILDVKRMHGTMNCGHVTRAHVIIICDEDQFDTIYNLTGII